MFTAYMHILRLIHTLGSYILITHMIYIYIWRERERERERETSIGLYSPIAQETGKRGF
jgi:hypothetical protein